MNTLTLIAGILQALALIGRNDAIGFDASRYADMLDFLARLVARGNAATDELRKLRTEVESILVRGNPPTVDEVAGWKARSDAAHAAIQSLKDRAPDLTDDPDSQKG